MNKRSVGSLTEHRACEYLCSQGCMIVERNYSCRLGEIDIVARDGEELVFAEVKYRRSRNFGLPEHAITATKMRRMRRVAEWYMAERGISSETALRFDVIAMDSEELRWYRNAF